MTTRDEIQLSHEHAEEARRKHREFLMPGVANYYKEPIVVHEGRGCRVRDVAGREYLDFFGGILTVSIGHGNERVRAAIEAQVARLTHISSLYPTLPVVELAERLARITPGRLRQSYFLPSGTDADETAVMLAQLHTGRHEVIALRHGYSGRGMLAQALQGHAPWRPLTTQVPGIKHALSPYCYRCPLKLTYPSCNVQCARDIEELVQTTTVGEVAAFIAEPIQGVGGFVTPPREYFEIAVEIVRRKGGLFVCDEVQTGFGRTGEHWFGIEHYGVEPDILTGAKGIANGMPIAVTITRPEIAQSLRKLTISTFGGNPVAAAAANATLGFIEDEGLLARVAEAGAMLRAGLERLQAKYPHKIGDVRGKGLMIGVEMVRDEVAGDRTPDAAFLGKVFEEAKERELLLGKGGLHGNVFRIAPAMTVSDDEIREALEKLDAALAAACAG